MRILLAITALAAPVGHGPVVYVGDSLGVGTFPPLVARMPAVRFEGDTRVGRTSSEGLAVLRARLRPRHRVIVFDLGTNDFDVATLTRNLRVARRQAGARLMVVFTLNKPGADPFNRAIGRFAAARRNVMLLDWHSLAAKQQLLGGDGIHASAGGYARRAGMLARCLASPSRRCGRS